MTRPYVIIGAGMAGAWMCRTLRAEGYEGELILIGAEAHLPYERPPLSKSVLKDPSVTEGQDLLTQDDMQRLNINFRPSTSVTQINPAAKQVTLQTGEPLPYTKLGLCMGGQSRTLPVPKALQSSILTLRTLEDAHELSSRLKKGATLGIIGGGWIGLEVAATARALGCEVRIFEAGQALCARSVMPEVSKALLSLHTQNGVELHLDCGAVSLVEGSDGKAAIQMANGAVHEFNYVLLAVGMNANDSLAKRAGLACQNGIVVNENCQTSNPYIFAAGDVTLTRCAITPDLMRLENWQNAQDQAIAAAKAMLGQAVHYIPIPRIWSEQYDQFIRIEGVPHLAEQVFHYQEGSSEIWIGTDASHKITSAVSFNAMRPHRFTAKALARGKSIEASLWETKINPIPAAFIAKEAAPA